MMIVDKNVVIPSHISTLNPVCKNGILFKKALFQNQILRQIFNQTHQVHIKCIVSVHFIAEITRLRFKQIP